MSQHQSQRPQTPLVDLIAHIGFNPGNPNFLRGAYEDAVFGYFLPLHSTLGTRKKLMII